MASNESTVVLGFQFEPIKKKRSLSESSWETYDSDSSEQHEDGESGPPRTDDLRWCKCYKCSIMSASGFLSESECICCHEIPRSYFYLTTITPSSTVYF